MNVERRTKSSSCKWFCFPASVPQRRSFTRDILVHDSVEVLRLFGLKQEAQRSASICRPSIKTPEFDTTQVKTRSGLPDISVSNHTLWRCRVLEVCRSVIVFLFGSGSVSHLICLHFTIFKCLNSSCVCCFPHKQPELWAHKTTWIMSLRRSTNRAAAKRDTWEEIPPSLGQIWTKPVKWDQKTEKKLQVSLSGDKTKGKRMRLKHEEEPGLKVWKTDESLTFNLKTNVVKQKTLCWNLIKI